MVDPDGTGPGTAVLDVVHCGTVVVIPDAKRAGDGARPGERLVGNAASAPKLRRRGGAAVFVVRQPVVGAGDKVGEKCAILVSFRQELVVNCIATVDDRVACAGLASVVSIRKRAVAKAG